MSFRLALSLSLVAASAFTCAPVRRTLPGILARTSAVQACGGMFDARRAALASTLEIADGADAKSNELKSLYEAQIAPLEPAIWSAEYASSRQDALRELARALDLLEEAVVGPMLTGPQITQADVRIFPAVCLLHHALPTHFGWTEWTDEALFYRRPRLHAWWELMLYEPAAEKVAADIGADVQTLAISWGVDVPTSGVRDFPKHTDE